MSTSSSWLSSLLDLLARLFKPPPPAPPAPPIPPDSGVLEPLQPRVLMIVYNPVVDTATGKKLIATMRWHDPDQLAAGYIADLRECSNGLANYQIVQRVEIDELPVKADGFQYQPQDYVNVAQPNGGRAHDPDEVDYGAILAKFNLLQRVANNEIDEVWLFGGPYFGFYESTMAGKGAFFCNSSPVPNTAPCPRRFVIMGFNYERGIGEMEESLGHRAEFVLQQVFRYTPRQANLLERYLRYDQIAPGQANVGTIHYAPNSLDDYQWDNKTPVPSCCDDWYQFPNLPDPPNYRMVDAREWGGGDIRAHHKWWLKHLPKAAGVTNSIANNWWKYMIDPNTVR